jgi:predicted component of viral defense system (DUF524 family)
MDSPPISKLSFLSPEGKPIEGPSEWTPALLEVLVHDAEERKEVELRVQGEVVQVYLRSVAGKERVLADWPRSDCGYYRVGLEMPGWREERTFTIWPQKISRDEYGVMLEDLETRLPAAVALALQRGGGLAGVEFIAPSENTLAEELKRLERAVRGTEERRGLDKVLPAIEQDPHKVLINEEPWVRRDQARRPSPVKLIQAYTAGYNLDEGGQLLRVIDRRVEHTLDVYENRLVRVFYEQVAQRLRRLVRILRQGAGSELLERALALQRVAGMARGQAPFLDEVSLPAYVPTQLTMVLMKRATYRAALEGWLELHRRVVVRLEEPAFDAPLENLPSLYQTWGTLEVILALQEVAIEMGYKVKEQRLVRREGGEVFVRVLPDGKSALVLERAEDGTQVRLIPERSYGKGGRLRSVSYTQRPDIAVEVERGGEVEVWIFDPKYKLDSEKLKGTSAGQAVDDGELLEDAGGEVVEDGALAESVAPAWTRPKKVDIDKMHAYRDAIRDGTSGERVVCYAGILYPGASVVYGSGLGAISAMPGAEQSLQASLRTVLRAALDMHEEQEG